MGTSANALRSGKSYDIISSLNTETLLTTSSLDTNVNNENNNGNFNDDL